MDVCSQRNGGEGWDRLRVVLYMYVTSTWQQGLKRELRPRVTVKTLPHYVALKELHFVYLDLVGLTKVFVVTLINTQSQCAKQNI